MDPRTGEIYLFENEEEQKKKEMNEVKGNVNDINLKWYQENLRDCYYCNESYKNQKILNIEKILPSRTDLLCPCDSIRLYVLCPTCNNDYFVKFDVVKVVVKK